MPHPALFVGSRYADLIRNTPGLIAYWRMRDVTATLARNELATVGATMTGSPLLYQGTPIADGAGIKFNGTSQALSAAIALSAFAQVSVSFWMWQDAWLAPSHLPMEYGNPNLDSVGAAGFLLSPSTTAITVGFALFSGTPKYWLDTFTVPSAAAWHHYVCTFNRATPVNTVYVDGAVKTLTASTHNVVTYGNFANGTLNLMSRAASSFWNAGRLSEVAVFSTILSANDARTQYQIGIG